MNRFVKAVKEKRDQQKRNPVFNFMGGVSFEINPIDTLKMVTASSIFGEPQYYRDGEFTKATIYDGVYSVNEWFKAYTILNPAYYGLKTSEIMEKVIDNALNYDFQATIEWALTLRKDFYMRLNPQVIMVRAAMHPKRVEFNTQHPGVFSSINALVMARADEPGSQLTYFLYLNGTTNNLPNILKRNWARKLSSLNAYQVHKYKNTGIGIIDTVRVSHAHSAVLDELMTTGNVHVDEQDNTWEAKRAAGMNWKDIYKTTTMGHMAILRNLRGMFREVDDIDFCQKVLDDLKKGVLQGKQFPFRYYSALEAVKQASNINHSSMIIDALEECLDIACDNMPKLSGKTMCLSDNSGSAWGTCTSEYGKVTIAKINNLSSVIAAKNSDEGYVGKFGDKLIVTPVSKRNGTLIQAEAITKNRYNDVGGSTENGIWIFFRDAIDQHQHWDNIFIYSDQQAGHGGLYGTDKDAEVYRDRGFSIKFDFSYMSKYIHVSKLIDEYRRKVNPKVNVFSIQTAGYTNVLVPEYGYRTNILYGWTGKELVFADEMIRFWNQKDEQNQ